MLVSIAFVIILGLLLGSLAEKLKLPSLIGLLFTGLILGPYCLNLLSPNLLAISSEIRTLALIIILTRAGLSLDLGDLKKVGRPAIFMCFVPALFEIIATVIFAPILLHISLLEALLLGTTIAAVSPAVVVPRMIRLMKEGYGTNKFIPQIVLTGASVDAVFVLVLFTSFLGLNEGKQFSAIQLTSIPIAILSGVCLGFLIGYLFVQLFHTFHMRDSVKMLLLLAVSFLLMGLETSLKSIVPFSSTISVMSIGLMIFRQKRPLAERLSLKFNKVWIIAEIFLFVLVGASVDLSYAFEAGIWPLVLLVVVSLFRMLGVYLSLLNTSLNFKEVVFCMMCYLPKATVQAAIGSIPLSLGLASGEIILTVAVLSILLTAPIGAWLMDHYSSVLLEKET